VEVGTRASLVGGLVGICVPFCFMLLSYNFSSIVMACWFMRCGDGCCM
jgi:hypothetical protein